MKKHSIIENGIVHIPLTKGETTTVDLDDFNRYPELKQSWFAQYSKNIKGYYAARTTNKHKILMHRIIMEANPDQCVDHIDHNTLNNRRYNLRLCNHQNNLQNKKNHLRKFKGATWRSAEKKWQSKIKTNGVEISLGQYETLEEALAEYDLAAKELFGEFACLNNKTQEHRLSKINKPYGKHTKVTSKYRGVSWSTKERKWRVQINYKKKCYNIGMFDNEIDAAIAYDQKAIEFYGRAFNFSS